MQISKDNTFRTHLFLLGLMAGLCAYFIVEILPEITNNERIVLFIAAFSYAGFLSSLLLAGAMEWRKVITYALPLAVVSSLLLLWVSFRFDDIGHTFDEGIPLMAFAKLVVLPLPFFIAHEIAAKGWQDYDVLFQRAWGLFVKAFAACIFVGIFWGVMWTSVYLLKLVGLNFLQDLIEEELVWMSLTGGVFGLALAVLHEMETVVDTLRNLVVRLLRLLLPIVAIVTTIFLVFVPIRGLEEVFGRLSAAGTILWMAVIAVSLITASLDASDEKGTQNPILLTSARALAALLPIMAGIAVYALYLRVAQYGWTPERLLAVIGASVVLAYAAAYAFAVVLKVGAWRAAIRRANTYLALGLIGLSILWLTPVLNAQRISANTQLARFLAGKTEVVNLPLWELKEEWGASGRAALADLISHADSAKDTALSERLIKLENATNKYSFNRDQEERSRQKQAEDLLNMITVVPKDTKDVAKYLEAFSEWDLKNRSENCEIENTCILVFDDFLTHEKGQEAIFFFGNKDGKRLIDIRLIRSHMEGTQVGSRVIYINSIHHNNWPELRSQLLAGDFTLEPSGIMSLRIGDTLITPIQR